MITFPPIALTLSEVDEEVRAGREFPAAHPCAPTQVATPFSGRFYPLGFPADVYTNSSEVLDIVAASWDTFRQLFDTEPVTMHVAITPGGTEDCPAMTTCRAQQDTFSFIADVDHYGMSDMLRSRSSVWLTEASLKHRSFVRYHFLETGLIVPIVTRYVTGVHSACIGRNGVGVLLCGESGAGKSTLSYACAKAGWSYLTDDGSYLVHGLDELTAVGNCHQVRFRPATAKIFPEVKDRQVTQRNETTKPSIELVPSEFHSIHAVPSMPVHHLVMLNRSAGVNEPLRPFNKEVARGFLRQCRFSPESNLPQHYKMIDRLLERDVLELRYRDLDWAITQLDQLASR